MTTNNQDDVSDRSVKTKLKILRMKNIRGDTIKIPQASILKSFSIGLYETLIEYEDSEGTNISIVVAHSLLDVAMAVAA